jgi:hypothetical protein
MRHVAAHSSNHSFSFVLRSDDESATAVSRRGWRARVHRLSGRRSRRHETCSEEHLFVSRSGFTLLLFIQQRLRRLSASPRARELALAVLVLLLPFGVLYWLRPGGVLTIGNDYPVFSIENQVELQFSLARGSFPLYVQGYAGGRSSAALTLGQLFHPLSHLAAHSPGYWAGRALGCNTFWRLVSLGATHLVLLRVLRGLRLRLDLAFIASFLAVYNLRMLDMFRYGASLENYTGFVLLCAALIDLFANRHERRRARGPVGVAFATYLLVCGGHPQMAYLGLLGAAIALLAIPFVVPTIRDEPPCDARAAFAFYARAGACVGVGLLLAAAYLTPFYVEFVRDAPHRTTRDYGWAADYADSLRGALNSFFAPLHADVHGAFGSSVLAALALWVPFALAPARGVSGRTGAAALAGVAAVVFLCGVGNQSPIHKLFWAHVPLANSFRAPGRITLVLPALLALLLAWTFSRLERAPEAPDRDGLAPPLLVAQVAAIYALWHLLPDTLTTSDNAYTPAKIKEYSPWVDRAAFALGAATLILAAVRFSTWRRRALVGAVLVGVVIAQGVLQLRRGTWVDTRKATPTLGALATARAKELRYPGDPGADMQPAVELDAKRPEGFLRFEGTGPSTAGGHVSTSHAAFNRLAFTADVTAPGDLAFAIPYARQWRARVDGRAAPVTKSKWNEVQVAVPAGRHEVELRFESPASAAGMAISCLTLAGLGVFAARALDRRRARALVAALAVTAAVAGFVAWRASLSSGRDLKTRYSWPAPGGPRA